LLEAAQVHLVGLLVLEPDAAGMHLVGLPVGDGARGFDDRAVARAAAESGISVQALSRHYAGSIRQSGLMFGYAAIAPERCAPALERLARLLRGAPPGTTLCLA
jgi:GntR family transcriptional regulator / MocR family aminotransferase